MKPIVPTLYQRAAATAPMGENPGWLYLRRGEPPESRKAFARALAKRPSSPFIKEMMNPINN